MGQSVAVNLSNKKDLLAATRHVVYTVPDCLWGTAGVGGPQSGTQVCGAVGIVTLARKRCTGEFLIVPSSPVPSPSIPRTTKQRRIAICLHFIQTLNEHTNPWFSSCLLHFNESRSHLTVPLSHGGSRGGIPLTCTVASTHSLLYLHIRAHTFVNKRCER